MPQSQRIDRATAVADDGTVEGHADKFRRVPGNGTDTPVFHFKFAAEWNVDRLARPRHFPRIRLGQPAIGLLDLESVLDRLPKDSVFVPQAITDRGNLESCQRVDEAGRQPAEPAVAQSGVRFGLDHLFPILQRIGLEILSHELLNTQVDDVVGKRPADQKLHRQVVDPFGVFPVVSLLRQQPALRKQVAQ